MRLAYEQGYLTDKSLNKVQYWALGYHYYLRRRTELEDRESFLERQCMNLNYEMWLKVHAKNVLGDLVLGDEDEIELDLDELDAYFEQQEAQQGAPQTTEDFEQMVGGTGLRRMSGAQAPLDWRAMNATDQAEPLRWGPWV